MVLLSTPSKNTKDGLQHPSNEGLSLLDVFDTFPRLKKNLFEIISRILDQINIFSNPVHAFTKYKVYFSKFLCYPTSFNLKFKLSTTGHVLNEQWL